MSSRVRKRVRPGQTAARKLRAEFVEQRGVEIPACSYCLSRGFSTCFRTEDIPSCHRCTRYQKSCDGILMSDLRVIFREQARLKEKKQKTIEELNLLRQEWKERSESYKSLGESHQEILKEIAKKIEVEQKESRLLVEQVGNQIQERLNRLQRLETQDEFLEKKAIAIMVEDDALDREEIEAQRLEEEQAQASTSVASNSGVPEFDWEALNSPSQLEVDPALLALVGLGSVGGTGSPSAGQSSDVP